MAELSTDEYALIMESLMHVSTYIKPESEAGRMTTQAIQILKRASKAVPLGGSSSSHSCCSYHKQQKVKDLFQTFGLTDRIGR